MGTEQGLTRLPPNSIGLYLCLVNTQNKNCLWYYDYIVRCIIFTYRWQECINFIIRIIIIEEKNLSIYLLKQIKNHFNVRIALMMSLNPFIMSNILSFTSIYLWHPNFYHWILTHILWKQWFFAYLSNINPKNLTNNSWFYTQGPSVFPIEEMAAGNIVAVLGLEVSK